MEKLFSALMLFLIACLALGVVLGMRWLTMYILESIASVIKNLFKIGR